MLDPEPWTGIQRPTVNGRSLTVWPHVEPAMPRVPIQTAAAKMKVPTREFLNKRYSFSCFPKSPGTYVLLYT